MSHEDLARARALVSTLHAARLTGYGEALPGPLDATLRALARLYAGEDDAGRAAVRALIPADLGMLLLGFSDRLATVAARTGDAGALEDALLAHVIESFRTDPRENVFRLALVHHVAKKLGLDPGALFQRAAAMASPEGARELEAFAARSEAMKSLKTMRIREVETPAGVDYRYVG